MPVYSQNSEQQAIVEACSKLTEKERRFLDIGAYHPFNLSNTRALYELGWSGVMIEPVSASMTLANGTQELSGMISLLEEYGRDPYIQLIQCAVAAEPGLRQMYVFPDSSSSLNARDGASVMWVPCLTIAQLMMQFGAGFGFVNIDVEGKSTELAHKLLDVTNEVHCICCEYDNDNRGLLTRMTKHGYKLVYSSEENGVFAR